MKKLTLVIGRNIREIRVNSNPKITQEDLAERIETRPETISLFENGRMTPSLHTLEALAKALGVTPSRLLYDPDNVKKGDAQIIDENLNERLNSLTEENYSKAISYIEYLISTQEK